MGRRLPYGGVPVSFPGVVHAENFDNGGEAIAYHDTTTGNSGGQYRGTDVDIQPSSLGGYNVGWTSDGEWLSYSIDVTSGGLYALRIQVASPLSTGRIHARFGSVDTAAVSIPNTGGWQTWTTVDIATSLVSRSTGDDAGVRRRRIQRRGHHSDADRRAIPAAAASSSPSSVFLR